MINSRYCRQILTKFNNCRYNKQCISGINLGVIVLISRGIVLILTALLLSPNVIANEFNTFKKEAQDFKSSIEEEFNQYKKELEEGFKAYKNAYQEEFSQYKRHITDYWGEFVDSNNTQWVSYDKSDKIRRSLNFDTNELSIDVLEGDKLSKQELEKIFKEQIRAILSSSEKEAFNKDRVAVNVEKRLERSSNLLQTDELSDSPLFSFDVPNIEIVHEGGLIKSSRGNSVITSTRKSTGNNKSIVNIRFKIPDAKKKKAQRFADAVVKAATKEQIPVPLVFAIMETESSFNPMAKSHVPAFGLMQVVPRSAGKDATKYLFGKAKILSPSYLYKSSNNITVGSAYLHILYYRYLKKIDNPINRLYCAIAAYNTGAGNVAKAIIGTTNINKAARVINKMEPKEVYRKLLKNLPYKETRKYLKKVAIRMTKYQQRGI